MKNKMKNTIKTAIKNKDLKKLDELLIVVRNSTRTHWSFLRANNIDMDSILLDNSWRLKAKKNAKKCEKDINENNDLIILIKKGKTAIRKSLK